MKAIILAGGHGTRLKPLVDDRPKPLAEINGEPFLMLQIRRLKKFGVKKIILCVGYKADMIKDIFGDGEQLGVEIDYAIEDQLLDTAGAVKNAEPMLAGEDHFLTLNGDTFLDVNLNLLIAYHSQYRGMGTLCLFESESAKGKGIVELDHEGRIISFNEKIAENGRAIVNAGVYVFSVEILKHIPSNKKVSLERKIIPELLDADMRLNGFMTRGTFIDIGTPEDYIRAQVELRLHCDE